MKATFENAREFRGGGLRYWNVTAVTSFESFAAGAIVLDADLSRWVTRRATSMKSMFSGATGFRGRGLDHWDVSNVTDISFM